MFNQDEDEAENDYESYEGEADSNDTYLPTITAYSTTLEVPPAHLFENDDPEPDESELNGFDSPMQNNTLFRTNTPTGKTPFRKCFSLLLLHTKKKKNLLNSIKKLFFIEKIFQDEKLPACHKKMFKFIHLVKGNNIALVINTQCATKYMFFYFS